MKSENGITIVSLVISVVILFILAAISIGIMESNREVIDKSKIITNSSEIGSEDVAGKTNPLISSFEKEWGID